MAKTISINVAVPIFSAWRACVSQIGKVKKIDYFLLASEKRNETEELQIWCNVKRVWNI